MSDSITKKILYTRVSSVDQNIDRQQMKSEEYDYILTDTISGSIAFIKRPQAKKLIDLANDNINFELHVHEIDRLGRNLLDILKTIEFFDSKEICIFCKKQGIRTLNENGEKNAIATLLISVLGCVAEMELTQKKERQKEGIEIAKLKGRYKGRKPGAKMSIDKFYTKYKKVIYDIKNNPKISYAKLAKIHDVSPQTIYNIKRKLIQFNEI